jgi:hypothetical protein
MNIWKPIALVSIATFAVSIGAEIARAEGACHDQRKMSDALEHLRQARSALEHAEHNKDGWKDRAIQSTDVAIRETNKACEYAEGSGPVPHRFEAANYWGNDYSIIKGQHDPEECARLCESDPRCKIAAFCDSTAQGGWAYTCVLRSGVGPRHTEEIGIRSWIKP